MEQPILVTLYGGKRIIINEIQICSVESKTKQSPYDDETGALVRMSNGDVFDVILPRWEEWHNDVLVRK